MFKQAFGMFGTKQTKHLPSIEDHCFTFID